jgi:hypothetical protein
MKVSRRQFVNWAASASTLTVLSGKSSRAIPLASSIFSPQSDASYQLNLMPSKKEAWEWLEWMAKLGPKFTGNPAHVEFVNFLDKNLRAAGLEVIRDAYRFPRWDAKKWSLTVTPASGTAFNIPVTSYFPYSGETPAQGVTGPLVFVGNCKKPDLSNVSGKIAVVECPVDTRQFADLYKQWGVHPADDKFPSSTRPARGPLGDLVQFKKAGAIGVICGWTDISDANAADQYTPFSRPHQEIPALYVGAQNTAKLRELSGAGAKATLVLDATITKDSPTDTLIATLPGSSLDEVIIVNTHTDGTNATEENGGVAIVALAKYFAKLPKEQRKRTLVFPLTTGHFAGPWVPSIRGVVDQHPDIIKKAVAAVTIEHLACREWMDDAQLQYKATGKYEWSVAITPSESMAKVFLAEVQAGLDRVGVVNPIHGGFLGEGHALAALGIPTIGYIPQPNYLLAAPANGCIDKLDADLFYSQIQVFAKTIRKIDGMSKSELGWT